MIKNKTKRNTIVTLIIIGLFITTSPFFLPKTHAATDDSFSIMQISDTQFLSVSFPQLFKDTTSWIVNNSANYNLKMVIHTGDIVDNINSSSGAYSDPAQWNNANTAMSSLLNAGIPYCWDAGNHDQIPWNDASGTWLGSSYTAFNAGNMRSKTYWVSDTADSKNTAVKFSYNGYDFLIINVEYMASSQTLNWMKNLLDSNKGTNVIIAAHTYLNVKGGYGFSSPGLPGEVAWCTNFKAIIDGYPNIFLTLSGHDPSGTANTTRVGNRQQIFFNRQAATTPAGQTAAASVRIYTFNLTTNVVSTTTYCLDTQLWLTSATNQFTFNTALKLPLKTISSWVSTTGSLGSAVTLIASPTGGITPYTYQWYRWTSSGPTTIGTNSSQLQYTINSFSPEMFYCSITDAHGATTTTPAMTVLTDQPSSNPANTPTPTQAPTPQPTIQQPTPTPTPQITIRPSETTPLNVQESAFSTTTIYAASIIVAIVIISSIVLVIRKRKIKV
jgi:hypothetical protein